MARFDREFLVPYLRDVCSLELVEAQLQAEHNRLSSSLRYAKGTVDGDMPRRRIAKHSDELEYGFAIIAQIVISIVMYAFFNALSSNIDYQTFITAGILVYTAIMLGILWYSWDNKVKEEQERYDYKYNREMEKYKRCHSEYTEAAKRIPGLEKRLPAVRAELSRVQQTKAKCYAANVIPSAYRGLYPAVYLYRYFSTSHADDVDMILQTFVLEEIKDRLDEVIRLQRQSILNQECMIANQMASLEEQRSYHNRMEQKAKALATSSEEQTTYLRMIESNTAAAAYFAAANYVSNNF